jgi:hypothetical protein
LTSAERKQRRILKKFGAGGTALGGDEEERQKLENGKKIKGKPRVAGSARARELRAAAALARFQKVEDTTEADSSETETGSETEDDTHILKSNGKELVRVCGDMDENDYNVKREKDELMASLTSHVEDMSIAHQKPASVAKLTKFNARGGPAMPQSSIKDAVKTSSEGTITKPQHKVSVKKENQPQLVTLSKPPTATCEACSFTNELDSTICMACFNVLDPKIVWNHWRCSSDACKGGAYVNSGDYGLCQVCGAKKP